MADAFWLPALIGAGIALGSRGAARYLANKVSARRILREYRCAHIAAPEEPAALRHGWGGEASDCSTRMEVRAYNFARPLGGREHTIFGPYTNDFGRPGFFCVRFRLAGRGFDQPSTPGHTPVVVLDVMQAPFDQQRSHSVIAQRTVRAGELTGTFQDFDVECYTTGVGVYEYRARLYERSFDRLKHEITFLHVRVQRYFSVWDVL